MTVSYSVSDGIAHVVIDNPPVNATSQPVRRGLLDAVARADADPEVRAVVLSCAGRTFVAGADIREFDAPPREPHLPDVHAAVEAARAPWIAALHGTALGGGLELALACRARVALCNARLGLPEVTLGLIPGAGGTVRLPRLVAPELALRLIAGGKPIGAEEAHAAGLVDALAEDDLLAAATAFARALPPLAPTLERPPRGPFPREAADRMVTRARGQLSVAEAAAAVERGLTRPPAHALAEERATFLRLKGSEQSAALRYIFFAERATLRDSRCKAPARPLARIGVVGGGTMGAGIAAACLLAGLDVTLVERDDAAAEAAGGRVEKILDGSVERGILTKEGRAEASGRLQVVATMEALNEADLVIEAVFEDMQTKNAVFQSLDRVTRPDAVLATNTSYLDVDEIASAVADPSRVIGLHFFSPAHAMKLLEIVLPARVADDVVATGAALAKRLRKTAVLAGVCDGFIGNRIMSAYRREADYLVEDGALPWEVDAAMRAFGFPMGIFEMQDLAGLDIGWAMRKRRAATRPPQERYVAIADRLCEAGRLGRKTGRGWYLYEDATARPDPEVEALIAEERAAKGIAAQGFTAEAIMARILGAMQGEARAVLAEGIAAAPEDIDVAMTSGYGFPRWRGGPMFMAAREGPA